MHASVLLLVTLLSAGSETGRACGEAEHEHGPFQHSHLCYQCNGLGNYCLKKPVMCPSGFSKCMSSTIVLESGKSNVMDWNLFLYLNDWEFVTEMLLIFWRKITNSICYLISFLSDSYSNDQICEFFFTFKCYIWSFLFWYNVPVLKQRYICN